MKAFARLTCVTVPSAHGEWRAYFSGQGLRRLSLPGSVEEEATGNNGCDQGFPEGEWVDWLKDAIALVLAGRPFRQLPPLDWSGTSRFQQQVWQALLDIPWGEVRTYGELAAGLGRVGAARAVGRACGSNPIPVLVPCHRVIGVGGRLVGFSSGLEWKRRLLEMEGKGGR